MNRICPSCSDTGFYRDGSGNRYPCEPPRHQVNISITGVLCNREPATTQAEVVGAVEWLGATVAIWEPGCSICEGIGGRYGCPCGWVKPHTRLLHISPRGLIACNCKGCGSTMSRKDIQDGVWIACCPERDYWLDKIDGLLITGGGEPLNPDHVAHLIDQADAAGVPVWFYHSNRQWIRPEKAMVLQLPESYGPHKLCDGREYRSLPASMMGGK